MQKQSFTFDMRELEAAKKAQVGLTGAGADSETARKTVCLSADGVGSGKLGQRGGIVLRKVLSNTLYLFCPAQKCFGELIWKGE